MSASHHVFVLALGLGLPLVACGDDGAAPCDTDGCGTTCGAEGCTSSSGSPTSDVTADTSTSSGAPTSTSSADVTTAVVDGTTGDCVMNDECPAAAPYCNAGVCSSCGFAEDPDAACAALDPDAPLCVADVCVQCRDGDTEVCTGTVPVCDTTTNTCVGCTEHAQCPNSACHLDEGSCMPEDRVWIVDGDAGACGTADGSADAPFCTIGEALAQIGQASRGTVFVRAASEPYTEALTIDGTREVALVGEEAVFAELDATGGPTLTVDGATVFAWRLRWRSNGQNPAVVLEDAIAWIDRSEIVQNQGGGISATDGAMLHLRASILGAGGTGLADRQALLVDGATVDVVATTIAGNDSSMNASIRCLGGGGGSVRSSIIVGLDAPSISCLALEIADSVVDTPGFEGEGNTLEDTFNPGWFVDAAGGDFHLVPGTLFEGAGTWHLGDPPVDLDGDARPTRDGAIDVAGADVP